MTRERKAAARVVMLVLAGWLCAVACSDDSPRGLSAGCSINTDCAQPLVCAFQRCHNACTDSRDCPAGLRCVSSDRPYRVCQLPDEQDCSRTSDCPGAQQCAVDGQCHDPCTTNGDCVARQVCVESSCADMSELGSDGMLVARADASTATPCTYNSECPDPLVCKSGVCQLECLTSRDCPHGETCTQHTCVAPGGSGSGGARGDSGGGAPNAGTSSTASGGAATERDASVTGVFGAACDYPSDCPPPLRCGPRGTCIFECSTNFDCAADQCCEAHRCVTGTGCYADAAIVTPPDAGDGGKACLGDLECQDGVTCDGYERCVRGHCRPAAAPACDDGDPCTTDDCDEKAGTCTHKVSGPVDQDGDGHYAIGAACGSKSKPADDCDDKNPNVYPGHPELCDEVDNNCDGLADDGVWTLGTATSLTTTGAYPIGNALGSETTPAVVAIGKGFDVVATGDGTTGAVEAFRVSTANKLLDTALLATATGPDCASSSGKRAAYPTIAGDGTNFLAGFLQAVIQPNTCCAANARWTRSALGAFAAGDLSDPTRVTFDDDADVGCTTALPTVRVSAPALSWVPAASRYVAAWSDSHTGAPHAWVAPVSAAGVVGGAHTVTASETDSTVNSAIPQTLQIAASPTRIFVAFATGTTLRMVLLDPSTLSAVLGPVDLGNSFQMVPLAAAYSGGKFFLVHTTRGSFDISVLDAATLAEVRTASIAIGSDSLYSPRLVPVGNGVFLMFSRGATRLSYGWAASSLDSTTPELFPLTDVDLGKNVSGAGIAPLDDRHIAAAWVDGDVKTAILTCGQ